MALGALLVLVTGVRFVRLDVAWMLGALGLFAGPMLLSLAFGRTVLTKTGFTTSSLYRSWSCQWNQVARVETTTSKGRMSSSTWIVVYPRSGKPIRLRAPFTTKSLPDQELVDALSKVNGHLRGPHSY